MITDEPRDATYTVQLAGWQLVALGVSVTVFVFCLLFGAVLYRINSLVSAGLRVQSSCYEVGNANQ